MANLLWGKVYYKEVFAGTLREEPGDRTSFEYGASYLEAGHSAIAHTLPVTIALHTSHAGFHAFFDNLVAEGWLEQAQTRLLGKRQVSRFELLLAFGYDCAGAVSVIDPEPAKLSELLLDINDSKEMALLTSRASLSGIQPKLAVIERNGKYYPARVGELSTHIAKFPSSNYSDLIDNEYLTTLAFKALLPDDDVVDLFIGSVEGQSEPALVIKRFDRSSEGRIHFEEFNQLLGRKSSAKYDGSHKEMADFISNTPGCLLVENYRLFGRILAGILLGNTDMHFKNFAMLHSPSGLRLAPAYDEISAALYQYKTLALQIAGARDLRIGDLKARHIIALGGEFSLSHAAINMMVKQLEKNLDAAKQVIVDADAGTDDLKNNLIELLEKRWNGTFVLIGKTLSKKP
ncbi:MAG: HipA domain-containing protein [Nitrosomonas sp.]|nr:HipA domain-containing protein [Nitrosomonas sp.]